MYICVFVYVCVYVHIYIFINIGIYIPHNENGCDTRSFLRMGHLEFFRVSLGVIQKYACSYIFLRVKPFSNLLDLRSHR